MRLFVSVDLPRSLADRVAEIQDSLRPADGLRFVDPEQAHVTLKFLGETPNDRLSAVEEAIEAAVGGAGVSPFEVTVGGLGVFPSLEYISVVWVGVRAGGEELARLHEALERETTALGFDPEEYSFTPHATLARMNDARGKDRVQRLVAETDPTVGSFRVDEIRLKESTLSSEGPEYETVRRVGL